MKRDTVTQRILLVQPLKLAGEIDPFNPFSAWRVADSPDLRIDRFREFV